MRRAVAMAVGAVALLVLAACGSPPVISAADPSRPVAPGALPVGISLQSDIPACSLAGEIKLCQVGVWYVNGTGDDVTIDASTTDFLDGAGQRHDGTTGTLVSELAVPAQGKAKVIWSVRVPYGVTPTEVRWAAPDGSLTSVRFGPGGLPTTGSVSATPSVSVTPSLSATPSPSDSPTASPSRTATPTPTPTATPTATPTRTATPKPKPTTAAPPPPPAPSVPGGAIG